MSQNFIFLWSTALLTFYHFFSLASSGFLRYLLHLIHIHFLSTSSVLHEWPIRHTLLYFILSSTKICKKTLNIHEDYLSLFRNLEAKFHPIKYSKPCFIVIYARNIHKILNSAPIYEPVADNDNGLLTRHLRHLRAAKNTAAKGPAQEQPINKVSLPGKRRVISTSPVVINNRPHFFAVYSETLLAASVDISIKERVNID